MTVDTIGSAELLRFGLECLGQVFPEELAHILQHEWVPATARWKERLVGRGRAEEIDEARHVVVVSTRCPHFWASDRVGTDDTLLATTRGRGRVRCDRWRIASLRTHGRCGAFCSASRAWLEEAWLAERNLQTSPKALGNSRLSPENVPGARNGDTPSLDTCIQIVVFSKTNKTRSRIHLH